MKPKIYILCQNFPLASAIVRQSGLSPLDVVVITDPHKMHGLTRGVFALFPRRTRHGTTLNTQYFYDHMRQVAHATLSRYPSAKFVAILPSQLNDHEKLMSVLVKLRDAIPA